MLLGTFWTTLEVGEQQAAEGRRQAEQALDSLLSPEGVWGRTPWVQQKADAGSADSLRIKRTSPIAFLVL